jgi:hypothetical protein
MPLPLMFINSSTRSLRLAANAKASHVEAIFGFSANNFLFCFKYSQHPCQSFFCSNSLGVKLAKLVEQIKKG